MRFVRDVERMTAFHCAAVIPRLTATNSGRRRMYARLSFVVVSFCLIVA
jgi:hypothetical protein